MADDPDGPIMLTELFCVVPFKDGEKWVELTQ
jgi:hypothetical protein